MPAFWNEKFPMLEYLHLQAPSRRATLPSVWPQTLSISTAGASLQPLCAALDLEHGVYKRRFQIITDSIDASDQEAPVNGVAAGIVEQRLYAHRTRSALFVVEIELLTASASSAASFDFTLTATNMNASTCEDLLFVDQSSRTPGFAAVLGQIYVSETPGTFMPPS
jgi:hypothetical protein